MDDIETTAPEDLTGLFVMAAMTLYKKTQK